MANQPKVYEYTSSYDEKVHHIVLAKANYRNNNTLCVVMLESTAKGKVKGDWDYPTVNIGDSDVMANSTNKAFIDTNNMGNKFMKWLEDNNIAKPTGYCGFSGYCSYPLVEFTQEALDGMIEY